MPLDASEKRILEQLRLAQESMPDWAEVLDLQIALLEAQIEIDIAPVEVKIGAEEATDRRRQGIPLVSASELELDWDSFTALYRQVCQVAAEHRSDLTQALGALERAAEDDPAQLRSEVSGFMIEGGGRGSEAEGEPSLRGFALTHALRPFLRRYAEAYAGLVGEKGWRRGYCPICGGEPDLASLSANEEGMRHLLCSRCDNEWPFARLTCPFCESADHSQLSYYPEQDGPHRLYVCGNCKRYLKTIDLRGAAGRVLLPVERVLTTAMDVAAREAGYR